MANLSNPLSLDSSLPGINTLIESHRADRTARRRLADDWRDPYL